MVIPKYNPFFEGLLWKSTNLGNASSQPLYQTEYIFLGFFQQLRRRNVLLFDCYDPMVARLTTKHFAYWKSGLIVIDTYRKTSNIRRTLIGNKIIDYSDIVGASPVGAAPTTSSFLTSHLASRDSAKTVARQYDNFLGVGICEAYLRD